MGGGGGGGGGDSVVPTPGPHLGFADSLHPEQKLSCLAPLLQGLLHLAE